MSEVSAEFATEWKMSVKVASDMMDIIDGANFCDIDFFPKWFVKKYQLDKEDNWNMFSEELVPICGIHHYDKGKLFVASANMDVDPLSLCSFLSEVMEKHRVKREYFLSVAFISETPTVDGFGGMRLLITKDGVVGLEDQDLDEILREKLAEARKIQ